ncbi:MAG: GGDEF domain-containing protein [Candidatus Omnitrophica bacterium]|nr:GGDEF domain-containing protein [Candidatus Omnitrophota bacterium]
MLCIIIVSFVFNIIFYFLFKNILKRKLEEKLLKKYQKLKSDIENLEKDHSLINKNIEEENKKLQTHIHLYEMTRQIYKFLEEDKIFLSFKELLSNFIVFKDCLFIRSSSLDMIPQADDEVIKLIIDSEVYGFLVLKGVSSAADREKFYILAQQFLLAIKRAEFYQRVQELSIIDSLTGLFNRRYFLERLKEEWERTKKLKLKFSFLMIDVDNFKSYNDQFGHLVGDYILKEVASTIKDNSRHIDLVGRYGGEEFCVLLPQTDIEGACFAAERIRKNMEIKEIKAYDEKLKVTLSIGISQFPHDGKSYMEIIEKADLALYIAKAKGKNQLCIYKEMRG